MNKEELMNVYGTTDMMIISELLMWEWRDVENYEGLYLVSEWGDVMSIGHGKRRILKPITDKYGYLKVNLYRNGKMNTHLVHRLVATAFCEGADEFPDVNHVDEDKTNNCYDNLEWCTKDYNNNYGTRTERAAKKLSKKVRCIELDEVYDSASDASLFTGANQHNISKCCNGSRKTAGGYHWEHVS